MAEPSSLALFRDLIPLRRELAKQMRVTSQRYRDLADQKMDLDDSSDLIHDAIQNIMDNPVPDLLEYAMLTAELKMTVADLIENETHIDQIVALQEKQQEAMQQLRDRMRDLRLHAKTYGKVLPFRKVS